MKSVLISIRPEWVEKIVSGKKTIEVRKTTPDVPFKAYIYCTKGKPYLYRVDDDNNFELTNALCPKTCEYVKDYNEQNGKVIGEFICDKVDKYTYNYCDGVDIDDDILLETAIDREDINIYAKGKTLYGLHITALKIYDKPKDLREFYKPCPDPFNYCTICKHCIRIIPPDEEEYALYHGGQFNYWEEHCMNNLTRPPQSWCYVQELEDSNDK